eukprot:SAG11_NODE_767_length_7273_cov_3.106914_9_plen_200_part_00
MRRLKPALERSGYALKLQADGQQAYFIGLATRVPLVSGARFQPFVSLILFAAFLARSLPPSRLLAFFPLFFCSFHYGPVSRVFCLVPLRSCTNKPDRVSTSSESHRGVATARRAAARWHVACCTPHSTWVVRTLGLETTGALKMPKRCRCRRRSPCRLRHHTFGVLGPRPEWRGSAAVRAFALGSTNVTIALSSCRDCL